MSARPLLVALTLLAAARPAVAAAGRNDSPAGGRPSPHVQVDQKQDVLHIETDMKIPFPPEETWPVVLDYDHLASFMPNVDSSRVIGVAPDAVTVRQVGTMHFLVGKTARFELRFHRLNECVVAFEQTSGDFRDLHGTWGVLPEGDGSRVRYEAWITKSFKTPGMVLRLAVGRGAAHMMPAIAAEAGRRHGAGTASAAGGNPGEALAAAAREGSR